MMNLPNARRAVFVLLACGLGCVLGLGASPGCASAPAPAPVAERQPPTLSEWSAFEADSDLERVYIGGQPSVEALEAFRETGGTIVVNMRTEREMAMLPYYRQTVEGLGLEYVHVPTSGSEMGKPHHEAVREALDRADGPVLLHCGSGGRATYLWAGHMVVADGMDPAAAKAWCTERRGEASAGGEAAIDRIGAAE